jgi:hypothetical protein
MIRTVRSGEEECSATARQAAAAVLPLHGCPHITTSAMDDVETFRDKKVGNHSVIQKRCHTVDAQLHEDPRSSRKVMHP